MKAIFVATASCSPTRRPHCTRSLPHSRAIFTAHLAAPAQMAGSESRPVLSVVSAIFRPWPSRPIRFSGRHADVVEPGHAVLDAAQAHERVAPLRP